LKTWLFQANPDRYDILAALKTCETLDEWSITQHIKDVAPGDRAVLWVGGQRSPGVYAVGTITGEPALSEAGDDPYWRRLEDREAVKLRCPLVFDTVLQDNPIPKSELKSDPRFAGSRIITQPFAGNPFLLTDTEWQAIADRLPPMPLRLNLVTGKTDWVWDELVLACDLVVTNNWQTISESDPAVHALSMFLRAQHSAPVPDRFRSTSSVHRKLEDIRTAHPDYKGTATKGGKTTRMVVEAFLADPEGMHRAAQELRRYGSLARPTEDDNAGWGDAEPDGETGPDYAAAVEGRVVQRLVNLRERDPKLRNAKIRQARKVTGAIACEVCGFDFEKVYGELGEGFIHVHHRVPLHFSGETKSTLDDLVLVCVNCHQMIHRRPSWMSPEELKAVIDALASQPRPSGSS
jgi:5-methylcytosine-specific restriction enzyme A